MSISINFTPEVEAELAKRAEIVGMDVPTLVQEFVTERLAIAAPKKSYEETKAALDRIAARHRGVEGFVDDSRESIYAGHGE